LKLYNSVKYVTKEHVDNLSRIFDVGVSHAKKQTQSTSLGLGWIFLRDVFFFASFILFKYMISGKEEVDGMNFILYLITGIVPWNFINEVINGGSTAILTNSDIVNSIKFPITIIPTIEVVAIFIKRSFTLVIPFVVIFLFGDINLFKPLLFLYYFLSMLIFMIAYNLVVSAFIAISGDFFQLYLAFTRILFFFMPILWSFQRLGRGRFIEVLIKLNPMVYIILGFRNALANGYQISKVYTVYFWIVCTAMFVYGSFIQYKMRNYYADFM